jgi:hypothetical protein
MTWPIRSRDCRGVAPLPFVAVRPDRNAGALERPGEASAAFPDDPVFVVCKFIPNNLRDHNVYDLLAAQRFERTK